MAAYRELEREGHVELRLRSGIYVTTTGPADHISTGQLAGWVIDVLVKGLIRNVRPVDVPERVRECLSTVKLRAACIADNQDQIHTLCCELREDYGFDTKAVELDLLSRRSPRADADLRTADLLVTTALHASVVQRVAQRLKKPRIVVSLRPEITRRIRRSLEEGVVYFLATDPRFGDTVRRIFEPYGHADNLRTLIVGRDPLDQIPPDAPVHLMRTTHEKLGGKLKGLRLIYTPRVFAIDSARELLTFIVRANMAESGRHRHGN